MTMRINDISRRYWKYSLLLTVGLTFATLILIQVCGLYGLVIPLIVSSIFTLLIALLYSILWRQIATKHPDSLTAFYTASSGMRMLLALVTMFVYYLITGRSEMLPFVIIFMAFYIVMLIYHTIFISKEVNHF